MVEIVYFSTKFRLQRDVFMETSFQRPENDGFSTFTFQPNLDGKGTSLWRRLFNDLKMTAFQLHFSTKFKRQTDVFMETSFQRPENDGFSTFTFQPNLNVVSTSEHDVFSTSFQPIFAGWVVLRPSEQRVSWSYCWWTLWVKWPYNVW